MSLLRRSLLPGALCVSVLACSSPAREAAGLERAELAPASVGGLAVHALGGVYLAGQPSAEDLAAFAAAGLRAVVSLRKTQEPIGYDERARAAELGLDYESLPWNGAEELADEVFTRVRELLNTAPRPFLLHCASGNRVGAVWIPWRVLDGGLTLEQAVAEARTIGLERAEYEARARDYVRRRNALGRESQHLRPSAMPRSGPDE